MVTKEMLNSSLIDITSSLTASSTAAANAASSSAPSSSAAALLLTSSSSAGGSLQPSPSQTTDSNNSAAQLLGSSDMLSATAPSFNQVAAGIDGWSRGGTHRGRGGRGGRGSGRGGGGGGGNQRDASSQRSFNRGSSSASQSRVIIGKKVNEGLLSMKGADLTINKYVGRVHTDVTTENVREFLTSHKVNVVELEQLETKHDRFKSFRLRVKRDDLKIIEEHDFWPEGVLCGPFFQPKASDERRQTNSETTASGSIINGGT